MCLYPINVVSHDTYSIRQYSFVGLPSPRQWAGSQFFVVLTAFNVSSIFSAIGGEELVLELCRCLYKCEKLGWTEQKPASCYVAARIGKLIESATSSHRSQSHATSTSQDFTLINELKFGVKSVAATWYIWVNQKVWLQAQPTN